MSTISAHIIHGLCVSLPFFLQHAVYYKTAYLCKQNHIIWVDRLEFAYKMDFSSDSFQSNRVVGIGIYNYNCIFLKFYSSSECQFHSCGHFTACKFGAMFHDFVEKNNRYLQSLGLIIIKERCTFWVIFSRFD